MCQFTDAGEWYVSISTGARKKALVVGISDYTNLQKLDFCRNDGKEVYDLLTSVGYEISDKNKLVGALNNMLLKVGSSTVWEIIRKL